MNAIPTIDRMVRDGFSSVALTAMPTFTNPNNVSIVCGVPSAVHGVSGNFYLDRMTGEEIMMVDATPMRAPTILAGFAKAGAKVVARIDSRQSLRRARHSCCRPAAIWRFRPNDALFDVGLRCRPRQIIGNVDNALLPERFAQCVVDQSYGEQLLDQEGLCCQFLRSDPHGRGETQSAFKRSVPPDLIRGRVSVRVRKTRQNKNIERNRGSIRCDCALV
jgi:hypothetical protein